MDTTILFAPVLEEIQSLKRDVTTLLSRVPENRPIKRYTPQDIVDNTPLSMQTVLNMFADGRLKGQKIKGSRKWLITAEEFERACNDAKSLKYQRPE